MPLTKLQFKPGINREVTSYANEGGWFDGDKVRFYLGFPEKIGGWQKYSSAAYLGTGRSSWLVVLDGSQYIGLGTTQILHRGRAPTTILRQFAHHRLARLHSIPMAPLKL